MDKYEIILYRSEEDKIFIAEVPELPGCMAHGDTHETAPPGAPDVMLEASDLADSRSHPEFYQMK